MPKREPLREITNVMKKEGGDINKVIEEEREKNRKLLTEIRAMRTHYKGN